MAISIAFPYSNTVLEDEALAYPLEQVNVKADFGLKSSAPGEVVLTNLTTPQNQPGILRIAQRAVKDIFAGTGIEPALQISSKTGTATVVDTRDVLAVYNDVSGVTEFVPVRYTVTMTLPNGVAVLGAEEVKKGLMRAVSFFFKPKESGSENDQIRDFMHGVLDPRS